MRLENWLYALPVWLRGVFRRRAVERELDEEFHYHIDQQIAANVAAGMSPAEARRAALVRFGGVEHIKDATRDVRRLSSIDAFAQDVRHAARGLRASPGFVVAVALTLALGIGVATTMFGVVDRLLLRPPSHVTRAETLRRVYATIPIPGNPRTTSGFGYVFYRMLQTVHSFEAVAASSPSTVILGSGVAAREVTGAAATAGFFSLLGVNPIVGRLFTESEDDSRDPTNVVVLGYEMWQREYSGSAAVLGTTLTIGDKPFTVIGVLPRGFSGTELREADFWIPMSAASRERGPDWTTSWRRQWLQVVVRLKPGVDEAIAEREMERALSSSDAIGTWRTARLTLRPISADASGNEPAVYPVARWLAAVALVVLLIACANVGNLLIARGLIRRREIAVRLTLGISPSRLFRLLLAESLMLAGVAGLCGVGLAYAGGELIRRRFLSEVYWDSSPVDARVLVLALLLTLITGVVIGVLPALQARRTDVVSALKAGSRQGGTHQGRLRTTLLVGECALAVALMITAGMFVRSLANARAVDLGFEPERVVSVAIQWPAGFDRDRKVAEWDRIRRHVAAVPGYSHVALAIGSPFGATWNFGIRVPGRDSLPTLAGPVMSAVTADYFATVGTRLVSGRLFAPNEGAGTEPVVIISEGMARALWPNESAVGKCVVVGPGDDAPCSRIVGVVRDAKRAALREGIVMQCYLPYGQERGPLPFVNFAELLVRPHTNASRVEGGLRRLVADDVPGAGFIRVGRMDDRLDPLIRPFRLGAEMLGVFGLLALIVAATGMYGVIAYVTAQRMHEFGVRVALGAQRRHLAAIVMTGGFRIALTGAAIGIALSIAAASWLEPVLFETSGRDAQVIGLVVVVATVVTLLASLVPSWRAMHADPLASIRAD